MDSKEPLLSTAELERLQGQTLLYRKLRRAPLRAYAGTAPSSFRGRGMELEDVRAYQPGDDVRHMDWRATARTHRPITKVFRDERQRLLYLIVDRSPGMFFGTRGEMKAATAARVAAILAFTALAQQEQVAGLVVDPARELAFPKTRGLAGVLKLLQSAAAPRSADRTGSTLSLDSTLKHVDRAAERGCAICFISDFHDLAPTHQALLRQLAEHYETTAIQIVDPAEETLAAAGRLRFIAPHTGAAYVIDTNDAQLRERYATAAAARAQEIKQLFHRAGIPHLRLRTDTDAFIQLEGAL